ncbi:MAG: hypothetical protein WCH37_08780, partial [Synechococcaceae cyanobacterium ELA182]
MGSATTNISLSGSAIDASGDVTVTNTSSNKLSASAQVASNTSPKPVSDKSHFEVTKPSGSKSGLAVGVTYGTTGSTVEIDSTSSINAGGNITMLATSKPSGSASAKTSIYVDGAFALMSAANQDNAFATITIDGNLTSGQSASPPPVPPSVDYIPSQAYSVASDGSVTNASGQAVGPSITLDNGQVIRFAANGNDLYTFLGSSGSSVDLAAINPITDSRFAQAPAWSFGVNPDLQVGDTVKAVGFAPAYTYIAEPTLAGTSVLKNANGTAVARIDNLPDGSSQLTDLTTGQPGFRFVDGDVVRWSDGQAYQYLADQPQTINTYTNFPFNPLEGWNLQSFLQDNQPLQITAILRDPSMPGSANYVLAADQPEAISAAGATGTQHLLYASGSLQFNGGSSDAVDVANSEILVAADQIDLYNRFSQGQVVTYTVQADATSKQDSFPIDGVVSGIPYYLIKRGIDAQGRGRLALAANPDDVVANNWILFSALGAGGVHLLSGELGGTAALTLTPDPAISPASISPVAQTTALQLLGTYGNGDTINLGLLNSAGGSDAQVFTHTFAGLSGDQAQIQQQAVQQLVAGLNASQAIGSGVGAFLQASIDPASPNALLLQGLVAGVPFSVLPSASNASVAQISQLQLQGTFQAGDQIQLEVARADGRDTATFTYTTVNGDSQEIAGALALFLQSQPFATASTGYLTVAFDPASTATLQLTAQVPG